MYSIGQILFIVLASKNQVYPMQVIEVITKKTLKGEEVSYLLQAGPDGNTIMLEKVDGEVFDSSEKARKTLIQRATQQVSRLVDNAEKKSVEWYSRSAQKEPLMQTIEDLPDLSTKAAPPDESATVMLPDGSVAKVKLPASV